MNIYNTGILYTNNLYNYMHEDAVNSDIVKKQLEYGVDKNVLNGHPFEDYESDFYSYTKEYAYEITLRNLGYLQNINYIRVYTDNFENRSLINEYLQKYNIGLDSTKQVRYRDYMGDMATELASYVKMVAKVLMSFSVMALLISSIMIALLMYINVMERIREIGLLRSIGYSNFNVSLIFILEGVLIGAISGIIGDILSLLLIKPFLKFLSKIVSEGYLSVYNLADITSVNLGLHLHLLIVLGSSLLAILATIVPTIIASKKDPVETIYYRAD